MGCGGPRAKRKSPLNDCCRKLTPRRSKRSCQESNPDVFCPSFVERLWRTVKYEEVYLKSYRSQIEAHTNLEAFLRFYNERRPHSAFGDSEPMTPMEVYRQPIPLAINQ